MIALEYNTIVQNKERKNGATLSPALWSDLPVIVQKLTFTYRKVVNTSPSCLEAHAGFFRLSMKGNLMLIYCDPLGKSRLIPPAQF